MNQLVIMNNQQAVTTSLSVAENFSKNHRDVLKAIDELKEGVAQNFAGLFQEGIYIHHQNKQQYRMYYMNRDGFTLLVMGFTGKEFLQFKLKYIDAFNKMEDQLKQKLPQSPLEIMQMQIQQMIEHDKRINQVEQRMEVAEQKQENIEQILSLNPVEWRRKVTKVLNRIAEARGGFEEYRNTRNESYQLLEQRGRCLLDRRLNNRKKEMICNGVPKSKVNKISKLDVIAEDIRLTEIYLAIVKEMAIKFQVNAEGLGA